MAGRFRPSCLAALRSAAADINGHTLRDRAA